MFKNSFKKETLLSYQNLSRSYYTIDMLSFDTVLLEFQLQLLLCEIAKGNYFASEEIPLFERMEDLSI